jgi:hypothetical protein
MDIVISGHGEKGLECCDIMAGPISNLDLLNADVPNIVTLTI